MPDDQLSLAIGRRGQNVRLASQLTGWEIDILTEAEESERRQKRVRRAHRSCSWRRSTSTRWSAQLLVAEGFAHARGGRLCRARRARLDRGLRRGHRRASCRPAPATTSPRIEAEQDAEAQGARRRGRAAGDRRHHHRRCWSRSARPTSRRSTTSPACATDELVGWTERKDGEATRTAGLPRRLRICRAPTPRRMIMAPASRPAGSSRRPSRRRGGRAGGRGRGGGGRHPG